MKQLFLSLLLLLLPRDSSQITLNIGGQAVETSVGENVGGGFTHLRFAFKFALQQGVVTGQADVESLLCRTQDYLAERLNNNLKDRLSAPLAVKATGIEWTFLGKETMPVRVNFTASVTTAKESNDAATTDAAIPEVNEMREALQNLDMAEYVNTVAHASGCPTGFSQATQATYVVNLTPEIRGDLAEATCQNTCAPTVTPGSPTGKYGEFSLDDTTCCCLDLSSCRYIMLTTNSPKLTFDRPTYQVPDAASHEYSSSQRSFYDRCS